MNRTVWLAAHVEEVYSASKSVCILVSPLGLKDTKERSCDGVGVRRVGLHTEFYGLAVCGAKVIVRGVARPLTTNGLAGLAATHMQCCVRGGSTAPRPCVDVYEIEFTSPRFSVDRRPSIVGCGHKHSKWNLGRGAMGRTAKGVRVGAFGRGPAENNITWWAPEGEFVSGPRRQQRDCKRRALVGGHTWVKLCLGARGPLPSTLGRLLRHLRTHGRGSVKVGVLGCGP